VPGGLTGDARPGEASLAAAAMAACACAAATLVAAGPGKPGSGGGIPPGDPALSSIWCSNSVTERTLGFSAGFPSNPKAPSGLSTPGDCASTVLDISGQAAGRGGLEMGARDGVPGVGTPGEWHRAGAD